MALVGIAVLATVPWAFIGASSARVAGVPIWLWWSFLATAALSTLTAWGVLRRWRDDRLE